MFRSVTSLAIVACIAATSLVGLQPVQAGPYPLPVLKKMLRTAQEQLAKVERRIAEVKAEIVKLESKSDGPTNSGPSDKDIQRLAEFRHELSKLIETAAWLRGHIEALKREIAAVEQRESDSID
jgi:hypothetical protein